VEADYGDQDAGLVDEWRAACISRLADAQPTVAMVPCRLANRSSARRTSRRCEALSRRSVAIRSRRACCSAALAFLSASAADFDATCFDEFDSGLGPGQCLGDLFAGETGSEAEGPERLA